MVQVLNCKFTQLLLEVVAFYVSVVFCVPSLCYFHIYFLSVSIHFCPFFLDQSIKIFRHYYISDLMAARMLPFR